MADYRKYNEFRTYLNQVYILTYEDVIEKIQTDRLDYETEFLQTILDEFKRAKSLEDKAGSDEVVIVAEGRDEKIDIVARTKEMAPDTSATQVEPLTNQTRDRNSQAGDSNEDWAA